MIKIKLDTNNYKMQDYNKKYIAYKSVRIKDMINITFNSNSDRRQIDKY